MKYVITWEDRQSWTEEVGARSLEVFMRWAPAEGVEFLQFVSRVDGRGGFAVVQTDDPKLVARDMAIFGNYFTMGVYPVLDVLEGAAIAGEALAFVRGED